MQEVLRQIRALSAPGAKLALLWDNARIHYANLVRELAASEEVDIELVWNVAYRPDLMGVEKLWAEAKRRYRRELECLKAHDRMFDQISLFYMVLDGVDEELIQKPARHGEVAIAQA